MTPLADIAPHEIIEREIRLAALALLAGLPDRCCCPTPLPVEEMTRCVELCGLCGGLVATKAERLEMAA